jgi:hypothetical protein
MNTPTATYRIQFNPAFGFQAAISVISYLADLGISDLYASPIFKAVKGSLHGYDVVDPGRLNPELGGLSDFEALADELSKHDMAWIQDIVPNHMAMDSENRFLMDIFEKFLRMATGLNPFSFSTWIGTIRPPVSTREFWRHFLASSMGNASKMARSHWNTVPTASRLPTITSPSHYESNLISFFLRTWPG